MTTTTTTTTTPTTKSAENRNGDFIGELVFKNTNERNRFYSIVWEREPNPFFSSDPHSTLLPNI
jgi:hypothetical protein